MNKGETIAMNDMQKLESGIYQRFVSTLAEKYKIINNRIVFEKDIAAESSKGQNHEANRAAIG